MLICFSTNSFSQLIPQQDSGCSITVKGQVIDEHDKQPLEFATISIIGTNIGTMADSNGYYILNNLCPGTYILMCSHVGCKPITDTVTITKDRILNFYPEHHTIDLDGALIQPKRKIVSYNSPSLMQTRIDLSPQEKLKVNTYVSLAQTGARVTKPIVWGLYGNRVAIYENGVPITDQQWGQDHAPAITKLGFVNIIQNADIIPLNTEAGGGVISINSLQGIYAWDTVTRGTVSSFYSTNGGNYGTNFSLGKSTNRFYGFATQINGEFSKGGDLKAPNYYLTNTGFTDYNFSTMFRYKAKQYSNWQYHLTTKNISRENGVLKAAHIGNISDLTNAINSQSPLIIEDFSYEINNPRQAVTHDMYRLGIDYKVKYKELNFIFAFQKNHRQEYDIRRAGRNGIPSLDLNLKTKYLSINFNKFYKDGIGSKIRYKTGYNLLAERNINDPNTGIRPLIPNYKAAKTSFYYLYKFERFNLGARLNHKYINAVKYNFSNELKSYEYNFFLPAFNISFLPKFESGKRQVKVNYSFSNRAPAVNELFSEGLHNSAASIEEGNLNLKQETSNKLDVSFNQRFHIKENNLDLDLLAYGQQINNYIQLKADDELRQTIQGAFPVFRYSQTDAQFIGFIANLKYGFTNSLTTSVSYRYLLGKDLNSSYLSFIPGNKLSTSLIYKNVGYSFFKKLTAELSTETVFKQTNYPTEGTFSPPPATYTLLNVNLSYPVKFANNSNVNIGIGADNLLNTEYRDYLDRLRYFAALPGRNIIFNLKYNF